MKKYKVTILLIGILFLSGCTTQLKTEVTTTEEDGTETTNTEVVKNEETGQILTANILCQPTDETVISLYEENGIDLSVYPTCDEFTILDGEEGLWETVFVKPLAWLILTLKKLFNNVGLALITAGILIRLAVFPITRKTAVQSENLKSARPELDKLELKYKEKTEKEDQMRKSQEMLAIYKKYEINPLSGCLFAIIQLPLFFAFYEAINRVPAIFESTFLGFDLGRTPWNAVNNGQYQYLILVVLIGAATFFSFKLNAQAQGNSEQAKQMQMMSRFMLVFISIMSFNLTSAIGIYWITSNTFTIVQNLIVKRGKKDGNLQIRG